MPTRSTTLVPAPERSSAVSPRILLLADSLAFHRPSRPEVLTEARLFPNVMAEALGAESDIVAQVGWTARHVWLSLTRDPRVYSFLVPAADAVVLAVGEWTTSPQRCRRISGKASASCVRDGCAEECDGRTWPANLGLLDGREAGCARCRSAARMVTCPTA